MSRLSRLSPQFMKLLAAGPALFVGSAFHNETECDGISEKQLPTSQRAPRMPPKRTAAEASASRMQLAQASMLGGSDAASVAVGSVVRVRTCTFTRIPVPEMNAVCVSRDGLMVAPAASIQRALIVDGYYERNSLLLRRISEQALLVASLQADKESNLKHRQQPAAQSLQKAKELLNSLVLLSCIRSRGTLQVQWADGVTLEAVVLDVDPASGTAVLLPVGDPIFRWWDGISGMLGLDRATTRWVSPGRKYESLEPASAENIDESARRLSASLSASFGDPTSCKTASDDASGCWHLTVSDAASLVPSSIYGSSSTLSLRRFIATGFAWLREYVLRDAQSDAASERFRSDGQNLQTTADADADAAAEIVSLTGAEAERHKSLTRDAPWMCPSSGGFAHVPLGLGSPAAAPVSDAVSLGEPVTEVSLTALTMHAESSSVLKETSVALSIGRAIGVGPSGLVPRGPMIPRAAPARETSVAQAVTTVGSDPTTANTHKAGGIATAQGGPSTSIRPRPWTGRFFGDGVLDSRCIGAGSLPGLALPIDAEAAAALDFRLGRYPAVADTVGASSSSSGAVAVSAKDDSAVGDRILRKHLPSGWWDEALRDAVTLRWCILETRLSNDSSDSLQVSALSGLFGSDFTCPSLSLVAHAARTAKRQQQKSQVQAALSGPSVSPHRGSLVPEASIIARQMRLQGWRLSDSRWLQQAAQAEQAASKDPEAAISRILADTELSQRVPSFAGLRLGPSPVLRALPSDHALREMEMPLHADTRVLRIESSALAGGPGSAMLSARGHLAGMVVAGAPGSRDCVERSEIKKAICRATSSPVELICALNGETSALKSSAPRHGSFFGLEAVMPLRMMRMGEWKGLNGESLGVSETDKSSNTVQRMPGSAVVIAAITADSPAHRAGLRVGDCILRAGGQDIHSAQRLRWMESEALAHMSNGKLPLVVMQSCARPEPTSAPTCVVLDSERQ